MVENIWRVAYFQREQISFISGLLLIALSFLILIKPIKKPETPIISEMTAFLAQEALPEPIPQPVAESKPQPVQKPVFKNIVPVEKETPHQDTVHQQESSEHVAVQPSETLNKQAEAAPVISASPPAKAETQEKPVAQEKPEVQQQPTVNVKYENYVLAYLEKAKRYPTSREARQSRPQGVVKIWLEINRAGALVGYGVSQSSGFNLLDNEALKVAKFGEFPPFPDGVYTNESTHRFIASLKYEVN